MALCSEVPRHLSWMLIFLLLCSKMAESLIECPLVWQTSNSGDPIPEKSIPSALYGKNNYVARAVNPTNEEFTVGRLYNGIVYGSSDGVNNFKLSSYDILTNPHGCETLWATNAPKGINPVLSSPGKSKKVARTVYNNILLAGENNGNQIYFVTNSSEASLSTNFENLFSYTQDLLLKMSNFEFTQNPFLGSPDMLGVDVIINNSPATVKQAVYQKKQILESHKITTTKTWGTSHKIEVALKPQLQVGEDEDSIISVGGFEKDWEWPMEDQTEEKVDLDTSSEFLVESLREIVVPPYTSVQVCTTVTVAENFEVSYRAVGRYSAPGLVASQVEEILANRGITGGSRDGNDVVVERSGTFGGNMAMGTEFISSPIDAYGNGGCYEISQRIASLKRDKSFGRITSNAEYVERVFDVHSLIKTVKANDEFSNFSL